MTNSRRGEGGEDTKDNNGSNDIMIIIDNNDITQEGIAAIMHQKDDHDLVKSSSNNTTAAMRPIQPTSAGRDDQMVSEWVDCDPIDADQLLNVDGSTIFDAHGDVLPSLAADFSTMQPSAQSSPASTSSSSGCSSCSSSSWAAKDETADGARSISANCGIGSTSTNSFSQSVGAGNKASCSSSMIVPKQEEGIHALDGFGEMDLLDNIDLTWDPSIFPPDDINRQEEEINGDFVEPINDDRNDYGSSSQELAHVFFEWLKSNKESISPQDLRSIKLKKSTIESAARRLGGGKEGMLQLLKLILAWVQNHHLQKKQNSSSISTDSDVQNLPFYYQNHQQSFGTFPHGDGGNSSWFNMPPPYNHPSSLFDPCTSSFPSVVGYPGLMEASVYGLPHGETNQPLPISSAPPANSDAEIPSPWQQVTNHHIYGDHQVTSFAHGSNYNSHSMLNGSNYNSHSMLQQQECMSKSATKEARKKRMARQRRLFFHHRHAGCGSEKTAGMVVVENGGDGSNHQNDQMAWLSSGASNPNSSDGGHAVLQRLPPVDRRQAWKTEKNLRLLLQKVLKQSDVGNLGRIVLPKKEAEMHLPELEARDGISIAMEDIGTSRVWNMRYRFWPNNKSRMYLLENTGDFVRSNGLQEGDFIVIYSDVKCGKYLIRGVKVPNQGGNKLQIKGQKNFQHKCLKLTNGEFCSSNME